MRRLRLRRNSRPLTLRCMWMTWPSLSQTDGRCFRSCIVYHNSPTHWGPKQTQTKHRSSGGRQSTRTMWSNACTIKVRAPEFAILDTPWHTCSTTAKPKTNSSPRYWRTSHEVSADIARYNTLPLSAFERAQLLNMVLPPSWSYNCRTRCVRICLTYASVGNKYSPIATWICNGHDKWQTGCKPPSASTTPRFVNAKLCFATIPMPFVGNLCTDGKLWTTKPRTTVRHIMIGRYTRRSWLGSTHLVRSYES